MQYCKQKYPRKAVVPTGVKEGYEESCMIYFNDRFLSLSMVLFYSGMLK